MRSTLGAPRRLLTRLAVLAALVQQCATARRECGLVVVVAGAPRTGSTQQERLVNVALKELALTDKVSDAGYYEWAKHAKLEGAEAREYAAGLEARPGSSACACAPTSAHHLHNWMLMRRETRAPGREAHAAVSRAPLARVPHAVPRAHAPRAGEDGHLDA